MSHLLPHLLAQNLILKNCLMNKSNILVGDSRPLTFCNICVTGKRRAESKKNQGKYVRCRCFLSPFILMGFGPKFRWSKTGRLRSFPLLYFNKRMSGSPIYFLCFLTLSSFCFKTKELYFYVCLLISFCDSNKRWIQLLTKDSMMRMLKESGTQQ